MGEKRSGTSLRATFDSVRQRYFRAWDRERQWHVRHRDLPGCGKCIPERREIAVGFRAYSGPFSLDVLLIHEICHAVANCSHEQPWQRRMLKCADRAAQLREHEIELALREQVAKYRESPKVTAHSVYGQIEDAVAEAPAVAWLNLKLWVARENGMTLPELDSAYPRARAVFDAAAKRAAREKDLREAFMSRVREEQAGREE